MTSQPKQQSVPQLILDDHVSTSDIRSEASEKINNHDHGDHLWITRQANDQQIQLDCWKCGPMTGELVILLHGFPESRDMWQSIMQQLAGAGFLVVAPNLRGYGQSTPAEKPNDVFYTELIADIETIQEYFKRPKCHLVGHDWGGAITWVYSQLRSDRLMTFTAINAPHPAAMLQKDELNWQQWFRSWYFVFFQLPVIPEFLLSLGNCFWLRRVLKKSANPGSFSESMLDDYCRSWQTDKTLSSMLMYYRATFYRQNSITTPQQMKVPCLILWGEKDLALTLKTAKISLTYTQSGKLHTFPDATHWLCHDKPNEVGHLLCKHLKQNFITE